MTANQNYVSNDLTHFVGRSAVGATPDETNAKRYGILKEILRLGWLTCKRGATSHVSNTMIRPSARLSENEMFSSDSVCFCDIPLLSLGIHVGKYGDFGIAFTKPFLLRHGVNPAFYVANDSTLRLWSLGRERATMQFEGRADYYDKKFRETYDCLWDVRAFLGKNSDNSSHAAELLTRFQAVEGFLSSVFSYIKCFDASKPDNDPNNFYMEREWRLKGSLKFQLTDIRRLILPKSFLPRLKADVPNYGGEVSAVEDLVGPAGT